MKRELNIAVSPVEAGEPDKLKSVVSQALKVDRERIYEMIIVRHSIDARNSRIRINLSLEIYIDERPDPQKRPNFEYPFVGNKKPVVIVGAGPAGEDIAGGGRGREGDGAAGGEGAGRG